MINIDIVHGGWLSAPNGVSSFLSNFKKNKIFFLNENIDFNFFTLDTVNQRSFELDKDIKVNRLKNYIKKKSISNAFFSWIMIYFIYLRHAKKIVELYKNENRSSNIIFFNDIFTCYYYLKSNKENGSKIVLVMHTNGDTQKMLRGYYPKLESSIFYKKLLAIEKFVLKEVDKVGFVADIPRRHFIELHPNFDESKTFFVYNGIENKAFDLTKKTEMANKIKFCCVGSLSERKGQSLIINTLISLPEEVIRNFEFVFVGDGPDRNRLETLVKNFDLGENVFFVGSVSNVEKYLLESDLFILCSQDEGLPISIIEAMRAGLPIVTTNVGGIPELVIDNVNGIVINPDNQEELKDVLLNIYNQKYNFKEMSLASQEIFKNLFTEKSMLKKYTSIFKDL